LLLSSSSCNSVVGEVNVSVAGTPAYWLNIKSNVTMGGSGSLTLNNCSPHPPLTQRRPGCSHHTYVFAPFVIIVKPDGIVVGEGMTLTQNVSIEVVDTKYSGAFVPTNQPNPTQPSSLIASFTKL
jgi:hypothetical protein